MYYSMANRIYISLLCSRTGVFVFVYHTRTH